MIRQGIFIVSTLLLFLVVWTVRDFNPSDRPSDEILAYEVDLNKSVEVMLHGGVQDVTVSSWLVMPFSELGNGPFPYSLIVELFDSQGKLVLSRTYNTEGRLQQLNDPQALRRAQLSDARAAVCDQKLLRLDTSVLGGKSGRLRIASVPGKFSNVLLRLAHRVQRSDFEQQLMARTLDGSARAKLTAERTSLGYFDIPDAIRSQALSYWQRRLSAAGREGRDYFVRRLLLSDQQSNSAPDEEHGRSAIASRNRALVYNLSGGASIRVSSKTATRLWLGATGSDSASFHDIKAGGALELQLEDRGIASVVLSAEPAAELTVSTTVDSASQFLKGQGFSLLHGRLQVEPDFRQLTTYRLTPQDAVVVSLASGQTELGLTFRLANEINFVQQKPAESWHSRVEFRDSKGLVVSQTELDLNFSPSRFEQLNGLPVSEPTQLRIHRPLNASVAYIYGGSELLVVPFVEDPDFDELQYSAPYNVLLSDELRFRYAPLLWPRKFVLRPDNAATLQENEQVQFVLAQVRLEPREGKRTAIAPRVLKPQGEPIQRFAYSPSTYSPRYPFPANGWTMLNSKRPRRQLQPVAGRQSILLSYQIAPTTLGGNWSLSFDSQAVLTEPLTLLSGERTIAVPPVGGALAMVGLGKEGIVIARAKPIGGGRFLKRQRVYALGAGEELRFEFNRRKNELLSLAIGILTENGNASIRLEHAIDSGSRPLDLSFYRRRPTAWHGKHHCRTGNRGRALLWAQREQSGEESLQDRLGGLYLTMGDDLPIGPHVLTLRNLASDIAATRNPMWVRAVLVGRALPPR